MGSIKSYRDLQVWQIGMDLVCDIYRLTKSFPDQERFGLTSQIQRAAISIPSNIAEGHARDSSKEFLRHLSIALGSLAEVETQLFISQRLEYGSSLDVNNILKMAEQLGRMIRKLQLHIKHRVFNSSPQSPAPSPEISS